MKIKFSSSSLCTLIYSQHAKNSHPDISSVTVIDFQVAFFKKGPYDELGGYGNPLSIPIFFVFKRLKAFQWMKCLHNNSSATSPTYMLGKNNTLVRHFHIIRQTKNVPSTTPNHQWGLEIMHQCDWEIIHGWYKPSIFCVSVW